MSGAPLRLGVVGGGARIFRLGILPAVAASDRVEVVAAASRSGTIPDGVPEVATYDDVLAHPDVEAVYVPLRNGQHRRWTERAAAASMHVLCEKPLAPTSADAAGMIAACRRAGVLLAEAYMTPFHRVGGVVAGLVEDGRVGELLRVDATFTFPLEAPDDYRWDPAQGGGALLDLGVYALTPLLELLGPTARPVAAHVRERGGVDATTQVVLHARPVVGTATVSFETPERQRLLVTGTTGRIEVDRPFTAGPEVDRVEVVDADGTHVVPVAGADPYRAMLEAFTAAVRGDAPWPRPATHAVELLALCERVRALAYSAAS